MHIAEVVTIAKSLPLLRLNTYKSLILSYSADYRRIFRKKITKKFAISIFICTFAPAIAQMAESVDALVSNTSGAIHPGSIPGLGTRSCKFLLAALSFANTIAQMAESVDALVSNTSGATHPGSIPGLGTRSCKFLLAALFFS